jgi:hypothetical protein
MTSTVDIAPAPIRRRRWLRPVAFGAAAVVGAAVGYAGLTTLLREEATSTTSFDGIRHVTVDVDAGPVRIVPSADGAVRFEVTERWTWRRAGATPTRTGDRAALTARCALPLDCRVAVTLAVPAGAEVHAATGAGGVTGTDLRVLRFTAVASAGGVRAEFTEPPEHIDVTSSAGDVHLKVPYGQYRVDAASSTGNATVGVVADPRAARSITVKVSAGSITIQPS